MLNLQLFVSGDDTWKTRDYRMISMSLEWTSRSW